MGENTRSIRAAGLANVLLICGAAGLVGAQPSPVTPIESAFEDTLTLDGAEVRWFRTYFRWRWLERQPTPYLDLRTAGGGAAIGVFDSSGRLLAVDDGDGPDGGAAVSLGATFPWRELPGGVPHDGRDGILPPLAYIAVANAPARFENGYSVRSAVVGSRTHRVKGVFAYPYTDGFDLWESDDETIPNDLPVTASRPVAFRDRWFGDVAPGVIIGRVSEGSDADVYEIWVSEPDQFAATLRCASKNLAMFLFDADGRALVAAADVELPGSDVTAVLSDQYVIGRGRHYLAVTAHPRVPTGCGTAAAIWASGPSPVERPPDGPGAVCTVTGWTEQATRAVGYALDVEGVSWPCRVPFSADYDESGGVDGDDIAAFVQDWQLGSPCADVDGSGGVDFEDLDRFFICWQQC